MGKPQQINHEALEKIKAEDKENAKNGRHSRRKIVPPTLEDFARVCEATRGRMGKIAEAFDVGVTTVYKWRDEEPGFAEALNSPREIVMDKLTEVAEIIAVGIPELDDNGKFVGWKEYPNVTTLHKLMDTYGMMRGFGRNPQEVNVNIKDGGVPIAKWLELNTQDKVMGAIDDEED